MSDILIIPRITTPEIQFSGSVNASASIKLQVLPEGQVAFMGKSGSLFSITDNVVGSLMAVSDISGLPILEVSSDDKVVMGKFNANTLVVTGSRVGVGKAVPYTTLDISGSVFVTGSVSVTGTITGSLMNIVAASSTLELVRGNMADNDMFRIMIGGSSNAGYVEFATADDGTEPIYFRQYTGVFSSIARTLTLLDGSGNTYVPGNLGIAKTTSNAALDVNGNTIVTGSLTTTGAVTIGGNATLANGFLYGPFSAPFFFSLTGFSVGSNQIGFLSSARADNNGGLLFSGGGQSPQNGGTIQLLGVNYDGSSTGGPVIIATGGSTGTNANNYIKFNAIGSEAARITAAGNVGIGTSSPNAKLDVYGNTIITGSLIVTGDVQADFTPMFLLMGA